MQKIDLNMFTPRDFQVGICDAVENKGFRKIIAVWPRRAGKRFSRF